ncbi:MAG: SHD1 domain-containing protein [Thermoguttaceae bacterium]
MSCRRTVRVGLIVGLIVGCGLFARPSRADEPPKLSYGFQKGREYAYHVKIVADLPEAEQTSEGVYTCKIHDATDNQFTLQALGGLVEKIKYKSGMRVPFGRRMHPPVPPRRFGAFGQPFLPNGTTISRQGNMISQGNSTFVPLVSSFSDLLFIEPLPKEAAAAWSTQTGAAVAGQSPSSYHLGPFSEAEIAKGATERVDFSILETKPDHVRISKRYSLHVTWEANVVMQIDLSGNGEFEFDRREGLVKSQTMQYQARLSGNNVNVTIPFSFEFRLLNAEELAAYKKKAADDQAAAKKALAAMTGPLGQSNPAELAQLLGELRSRDRHRVIAAALRLSMTERDNSAEKVSRALCDAMKTSDQISQPIILRALTVWATPAAEATVIAAAKSGSPFLTNQAITALGKIKTAAAAEVAAAALADLPNRHDAAEALKAMGAVAEPYVLPLVNSQEVFVRQEVREILAAIGGRKSLQALQAQLPNAGTERFMLENTIKSIETRLGAGGEEASADSADEKSPAAPATGDAAAAESGPVKARTWHDVTGTYSIEAVLIRSRDGKVTLKRADGKEITLPLDKLSEEDRAYVAKHAKPINPFE